MVTTCTDACWHVKIKEHCVLAHAIDEYHAAVGDDRWADDELEWWLRDQGRPADYNVGKDDERPEEHEEAEAWIDSDGDVGMENKDTCIGELEDGVTDIDLEGHEMRDLGEDMTGCLLGESEHEHKHEDEDKNEKQADSKDEKWLDYERKSLAKELSTEYE